MQNELRYEFSVLVIANGVQDKKKKTGKGLLLSEYLRSFEKSLIVKYQ
jgi:hypothetical protein